MPVFWSWHPTARTRLTLLYAGLFLVLGTVMLSVVYVGGSHVTAVAVHPASGGAGPAGPASGGGLDPARAVVVQQQSADQSRLLAVSWLALVVATGVSALLGWIAAGRVLAPVRTITRAARTISAGSLHQRLALQGPEDEFRALGDTLDELLGRLQASFDSQRRFVANASHELRTPLTLERTLLQVALADPQATAETLRATCRELLSENAGQERLLEALLTLATSERGLQRREPLDLAPICAALVQGAAADRARLGLRIVTGFAPAPARGDPALVRRLVANLLDNAIEHNVTSGMVELRTFTQDGRACLVVTNSGPPIPATEVPALFEPFRRLGRERAGDGAEHHGLGLSIVRAIADTHDATVIATPRPEGGLTVAVTFPPPLPPAPGGGP